MKKKSNIEECHYNNVNCMPAFFINKVGLSEGLSYIVLWA